MEEVQLWRDINRQIGPTEHEMQVSSEVSEILKYRLKDSFISNFFLKLDKLFLKKLDPEESGMEDFRVKVESYMEEQKHKKKLSSPS